MTLAPQRKSPRPMRASGYSDPVFMQLAELAHVVAGLVFPANRQPSAEAGIRRAMSALRISDPVELLRAAEVPGRARDAVLAELTVGESYFFRDEMQLGVLRDAIIPARLAADDAHRPLRVWSAGCASGEEPYSIAIVLRELGWPRSVRILGTDVAVPRLEAARRARYTRWALRGLSEDRERRWFQRAGGYFELDASVRSAVEFRALNLVHDEYAAVAGQGFDLVLCRNVMIYFNLDTVARIAEGLLASLDAEGWLVLGASDPPLAQLVACEAVMTPAGMAYRRANAARPRLRIERVDAPIALVESPAPERVERIERMERTTPAKAASPVIRAAPPLEHADIYAAYERADYPAVEAMAIALLADANDTNAMVPVWIHYIRAVANQGRLDNAGELCARALDTHALSAELHYLHAMLLAESGWYGDAAIAARRSIYLDRGFVMSHMLLGEVLTKSSDLAGARRAFGNALKLLDYFGDAERVPGADGVPATRLRQVADVRLRALHPESRR